MSAKQPERGTDVLDHSLGVLPRREVATFLVGPEIHSVVPGLIPDIVRKAWTRFSVVTPGGFSWPRKVMPVGASIIGVRSCEGVHGNGSR